MKIDLIAGARPNFMKISPIIRAIKLAQLKQTESTKDPAKKTHKSIR